MNVVSYIFVENVYVYVPIRKYLIGKVCHYSLNKNVQNT